MADLTDREIDSIWHRMGSFSPNDHRTFARLILREAEQHRLGEEARSFGEWWEANQACPEHTMITRNAAHAAWQERARRAHVAGVPGTHDRLTPCKHCGAKQGEEHSLTCPYGVKGA